MLLIFELKWSNTTMRSQASKLFIGRKCSSNKLEACFGITNYSNDRKEAWTSVWFSHKRKEGPQDAQEFQMTPNLSIACKRGCIYRS